MAKFNYFDYKEKRINKLSPGELEDLMFDLINAFALMNTVADSALLLQDLFTEKELKNLSKRLRIAKLILSGTLQEDIVKELYCSYATVAKVATWLNSGGSGIRKVINNLPKRKNVYKPKRIPGVGYGLPQILASIVTNTLSNKEKKSLETVLETMQTKASTDKDFRRSKFKR